MKTGKEAYSHKDSINRKSPDRNKLNVLLLIKEVQSFPFISQTNGPASKKKQQ